MKVKADSSKRSELIQIADIFRAKVVDVEEDSLMFEMTGTTSKITAFLKLMTTYGVLELARTGITGLSRGTDGVYVPED